jgi:hypothetical protein
MEKKKKEKQLDFGLKNTPKNVYYKYKEQYEIWLAGLETKKYIKDPLTWFTIILSSTLIGTQIYLIEKEGKLPSRIPIFNYFLNPNKRLISDEYIYLIPLFCAILLIITIILTNKYYHRERELSMTLSIVTLLANISICLLFIKLFLIF